MTTAALPSPILSYRGGYTGTGNLDEDPLFINEPPVELGTSGDLHLEPCSPAINAGDNAVVPVGDTTDLDGNPRFYNSGTVDMGAYEFQGDPTLPVTFNGNGDGINWNDPGNWSDGFVPQFCRHIIIPTGHNVTVPTGFEGLGNTIEVQVGASLVTDPMSTMDIGN